MHGFVHAQSVLYLYRLICKDLDIANKKLALPPFYLFLQGAI